MSKDVRALIQKLSKTQKKSVNQIKKSYLDDKGSLITDVTTRVGQHDIINAIYEGWIFNKKTGKFDWRKRKTKPPIIIVNITTYDIIQSKKLYSYHILLSFSIIVPTTLYAFQLVNIWNVWNLADKKS